jgi:UDP-N-acetylglucosamine 2-epimerase (non-hydrolysing)
MKIMSVVGARPNFMKISPFVDELGKYVHSIEHILVHTGQHYDISMSQSFFDQLGLTKPDINLEVGSASHAKQTARIMEKFEDVCLEQKPDWVVVVGDVNSTLACTLVAGKLGIRVAHIEAGLRSFDRTMPEEINRVVTDALADLLFTPSRDADANLIKEGVPRDKIHCVGNIMIDSLVQNLPRALDRSILNKLDTVDSDFAYVTLHRPSNVDDKATLEEIFQVLQELANKVSVILPLHPRTRQKIMDFGLSDLLASPPNGLKLIEPVSYLDSLCLTAKCRMVLTDSGGLQEESTYLQKPCLTLRPNTERPVTITQGTNKLTNIDTLWQDCLEALNGNHKTGRAPEMWDGKTAARIVSVLVNM